MNGVQVWNTEKTFSSKVISEKTSKQANIFSVVLKSEVNFQLQMKYVERVT